MGTMVSRKLREFTEEDIDKIADTYKAFVDGTLEEIKGFCAAVDTTEIEKQDYTYWHLEDMLVLKNKRMMGNHLSKR